MSETPTSRAAGTPRRRLLLLLAAALLAIGGPVHAQQQSSVPNRVIIDRRPVSTEGRTTLMEMLHDNPRAHRIGVNASDPHEQPLVVVDGVPLGPGVENLAAIKVVEVDSVTLLGRIDAQWRYGSRAARGAVVIETKRRRPAGGPR